MDNKHVPGEEEFEGAILREEALPEVEQTWTIDEDEELPEAWMRHYVAHLRKFRSPSAARGYVGKTDSVVRRWTRDSPAFKLACKEAQAYADDKLYATAYRMALHGWTEEVFGSLGTGEGSGLVGYRRKKSIPLILRFLESSHPEFRPGSLDEGEKAEELAASLRETIDAMAASVPIEPPADGEEGEVEIDFSEKD